jgi:type III secretory pathway component EscS
VIHVPLTPCPPRTGRTVRAFKGNPLTHWRRKAVGWLLLIALVPLLLAVLVRALNELAQAVTDLLGPVIPYAIVLLVLVCRNLTRFT